MGGESSRVYSGEPVFDLVDDFLKDRIDAVVKNKLGKQEPNGKYLNHTENVNETNAIKSPRSLISKALDIISPRYNDVNKAPLSARKPVMETEAIKSPRSVISAVIDHIVSPRVIKNTNSNNKNSNSQELSILKTPSSLANKFGLTIKITNNIPGQVLFPSSYKDNSSHTNLPHLQSVRALAIRHHSRQQNSYIPQEVLSSFISNHRKKASVPLLTNPSTQVPTLNDPSSTSSMNSSAQSMDSMLQLKVPHGKKGEGVRRRQGQGGRQQLNEDEDDWIQVSDDEGEETLESPRLRETLSLCNRQSYMFTTSGTIFVDGFTAGIGTGGIQTSVRDLKLPMKERLMMLCRLGQGASSVVYKALDLTEMKLVALKMISVFDRNKRRQMVRELSALFQLLRKKQAEMKELNRLLVSSGVVQPSSNTPVAVRISSRPSTRGETPTAQPASFYIPESKSRSVSDSSVDPEGMGNVQSWSHIVDFYDAFSNLEEGGVALMMEYMDGGSLQDIVDQGGCDDERTLASIAQQGLAGLDFLHSCNQIHRDLKPANMLIDQVGSVKLSDFGIMRQLEPEETVLPDGTNAGAGAGAKGVQNGVQNGVLSSNVDTFDGEGEGMQRAHTFVGTVTYMAPERIDGRDYSYPSDVWSLGLALLTLALGRLPLDTNGGFWSILHCVRDLAPPALPEGDQWSDEFRDFIAVCLKQDPAQRATCAELLKHPFLRKAYIDPDSVVTSDERSLQELRSVVMAIYEHVSKLEASSESSVLLEACTDRDNDTDIMDTLHRILFAESRNISSSENDGKGLFAAARLSILASQLHLSIDKVVSTVQEIFAEIERDRKSYVSSFMATPKAYHGPVSLTTPRKPTEKERRLIPQVSPRALALERHH
eukprot:gene4307-8567_t